MTRMFYPPRTAAEIKDETVQLLRYHARIMEDDGHNLKIALQTNNQEMIDVMLGSISEHSIVFRDAIVRYIMGRQIT